MLAVSTKETTETVILASVASASFTVKGIEMEVFAEERLTPGLVFMPVNGIFPPEAAPGIIMTEDWLLVMVAVPAESVPSG